MISNNYRKRINYTIKKNRKKSNFIGVYFKDSKYVARINNNTNIETLGPFNTEKQAARAYDKRKIEINPSISNNSLNFYYKKLEKKSNNNEQNKPRKRKIQNSSNKKKSPIKKKKRRFKKKKRRGVRKAELWFTLCNQKWECNICNKRFECVPVIDHVIPLQYGGTYQLNNLQGLCSLCNSWKTSMFDPQIKHLMMYDKLSSEEILEIQEKKYRSKCYGNSNNSNRSININNIKSSTISLTIN